MRTPSKSVASLVLLAAAGIAGSIAIRSAEAGPTGVTVDSLAAETSAVKRTALRALTFQMGCGSETGAPDDVLRAVPAENRARAALPSALPEPEIQRRKVRCNEKLDEQFVGPEVKERLRRAVDAVPEILRDPKVRDLGSGVSSMEFVSVRIGAGSATLEAKAHVWTHSVVQGYDGSWADSRPEGDMLWHFELVKSAQGKWRVQAMTGNRIGGTGP